MRSRPTRLKVYPRTPPAVTARPMRRYAPRRGACRCRGGAGVPVGAQKSAAPIDRAPAAARRCERHRPAPGLDAVALAGPKVGRAFARIAGVGLRAALHWRWRRLARSRAWGHVPLRGGVTERKAKRRGRKAAKTARSEYSSVLHRTQRGQFLRAVKAPNHAIPCAAVAQSPRRRPVWSIREGPP